MTIPSSLSNLNLTTFNKLYPLLIQKYNTLIPDPNANILDKINSIVDYLNSIGNLSNEVVDNWNKVMAWTMSDGLTTDVNNKIEAMNTNGEFNSVLNSLFNAEIGDLSTLTTTDKSKIVNAINELEGNTKTNAAQLAAIAQQATNVKASPYNAKGDGVTDDTTAIQNALDSLTNGGILFIPTGTYIINSLTVNHDHISIIMGKNAVLSSNNTGTVLNLAGRNNITIQNGMIQGNATNLLTKLVVIDNTTNLLIEHVTFQNSGNAGVCGNYNTTVTNCIVKDCTFTNTGDFGFTIQGGSSIKVLNNTFTGNKYNNYPPHAVYIFGSCTDVIVSNNRIDNCTGSNGYAIKLSGDNTHSWIVRNVTVSNNTISNSFGGVWCVSTQDVSIVGNVIRDNTATTGTPNGIGLIEDNANMTITGNTIDSTSGYGINVGYQGDSYFTKGLIISGNYIDCTTGAIYTKNPSGVNIVGNILKCKGTVGQYTIFLDVNSQDVTISGNKIERGDRAVMCYQSSYVNIMNNTVTDGTNSPNPGSGIIVDSGSSFVRVSDNNMSKSTGNISNNATSGFTFANVLTGNVIPFSKGNLTFNGDGTSTSKVIAHGLGGSPNYVNVTKTQANMPDIDYVTSDTTNITVYFKAALPSGTNNISLKWKAEI